MPVADRHRADLPDSEPRFTGDRAHDVARANLQLAAGAYVELRHLAAHLAGELAAALPSWARRVRVTIAPARRHVRDLIRLALTLRLARRQPNGRCRDVHHIVLFRELLDHGTVSVELSGGQQGRHLVTQLLKLARAQVGHRRHRPDLDLLLGRRLDVAQQAVLARLGQRDRHTFASGATGSANAVHVRIGLPWDVVVHHVRDVLDVEPTRRYVRGDQQVAALGAKPLHHPVTLLLRQPAVQRLGAIPSPGQRLRELIHLGARAAEHDGAFRRFHVEDPRQRRHLVRTRHHVRDLPDLRGLARRHGRPRNPHDLGIVEMRVGNRRDARRNRGAEQRGLPRLGKRAEDSLEVFGKSHVEHLVRFVEHHGLHVIEVQRLAADVVECASWRRDHHVDAPLERTNLLFHRRAAVYGKHGGAEWLAVAMDGLGHLHGKLTRRHEHQRRQSRPRRKRRVDVVQQGQRKGGGLAGAGGCHGQHVASRHEGRDRGALNWCRFLVAQRGQRVEQTGVKAEAGKTRLGGTIRAFGHPEI